MEVGVLEGLQASAGKPAEMLGRSLPALGLEGSLPSDHSSRQLCFLERSGGEQLSGLRGPESPELRPSDSGGDALAGLELVERGRELARSEGSPWPLSENRVGVSDVLGAGRGEE